MILFIQRFDYILVHAHKCAKLFFNCVFMYINVQIVSSDLAMSDSIDIYDGEETTMALYRIVSKNIGNYYTTSQSTARVVWNNQQVGANRGFSFRYATGVLFI